MKTFVLLVLAAAVWVFVIYSSASTKQENTEEAEKAQVIRDAIANHRLIIGMTRAQVIASWGKPNSVQKTTTDSGAEAEELDYYEGNNAFLTDGVLSSFNQVAMPAIMKNEINATAHPTPVMIGPTPQRYPGGLLGTDLDPKPRR